MKNQLGDPEAVAIATVVGALNKLEPEGIANVLSYLNHRFGKDLERHIAPALVNRANPSGSSNPNGIDNADHTILRFSTIGEAFAATAPKSGPEKALAVAAYLQARGDLSSFTAQEVSSELKHLGHSITNITEALGSLISQQPQLVIQMRKEGTSKQARKKYKVSEAGMRKVSQMITDASKEAPSDE